ncbi:hypothetical protein [Type-D symbiont of Plautia stali]|uniref:hypothetical protein n=1 Tax=Type-D symbiont of Plautia stali TaxID=1560356 RepID=UPI00073F90B7|nr:hypothetical protein [Type-D symbiont of Plautia stali]
MEQTRDQDSLWQIKGILRATDLLVVRVTQYAKTGVLNRGEDKKVPQPDQVCRAEKSKEIRDRDNRGKTLTQMKKTVDELFHS